MRYILNPELQICTTVSAIVDPALAHNAPLDSTVQSLSMAVPQIVHGAQTAETFPLQSPKPETAEPRPTRLSQEGAVAKRSGMRLPKHARIAKSSMEGFLQFRVWASEFWFWGL